MAAKQDHPAQGVCRLGTEWVNWYLVADGDAVTVVDCGCEGYYDQLEPGLASLGRAVADVSAIVLTHYHSDHTGFAERLRSEQGVPVYAPEPEVAGVKGEEKQPLPKGVAQNLWRPTMLRFMVHMFRNGAMNNPKVAEVTGFAGGETLDVPGKPRVIATPGHSRGHSSLYLADRGALISGDALCTMNFVDDNREPQIWPFNEDTEQARASLANLEGLEGDALLPGHGEPRKGSLADAVAIAQT